MTSASNPKFRHQGHKPFRPVNQSKSLLALMLFAALTGFEIFNYSTTQVVLRDLLGGSSTLGVSWAAILSLAFCSIDFAGIAWLFTSEQDRNQSKTIWYLFCAWLLAATMNAILTWWGISLAIVNRPLQSSVFIDQRTITEVVPVFLALMIWITRVLLIGSFSFAGSRQFKTGVQTSRASSNFDHIPHSTNIPRPVRQPMTPSPVHAATSTRPVSMNSNRQNHPELEYIPEPEYVQSGADFFTVAGQSKPDRSTASPKRV